jgi:ABC-2 type transport system permease protein
MMFFRILHHEWRSLAADRTLWIGAGLLTLMIVYAAFNGASHLIFQENTVRTLLKDQSVRFRKLNSELDDYAAGRKKPTGFQDPRSAMSLGGTTAAPYVILPRAPLAGLAIGQSDLYPYYIKAGMRSRQLNASTEEIENPLNLLSGRFDLSFVIVYLYPLLILAVSYNLISVEKEQGTLAFTLAQPVSLGRIVAGKVLLRAFALTGFVIVISAVALTAAGIHVFAHDALDAWLTWVVVVTVYGVFWFAAAIGVNALGKSSATNAVAVAGIWLTFVVLIPSLINATASAFYPVPSRIEMIQAMRAATKEATSRGAMLLARYMEDHPELAAPGTVNAADASANTATVQKETDRLIQPVLDAYDRQSALQQNIVDRFRFLSPAILVQGTLNDLSGSSAERYKYFLSQVDGYLGQWRSFFYPRVFAQTLFTSAELAKAPRFEYQEESATRRMSRIAAAVAAVLAMAVLAGGAALISLRKYRVA